METQETHYSPTAREIDEYKRKELWNSQMVENAVSKALATGKITQQEAEWIQSQEEGA